MSDTHDQRPVLYHCPQTRSGSALWMNEELGAPARIELVDIKAGATRESDFLKINPMGKLPALTHAGATITESAAICAYLADAFPQAELAPAPDDPRRGTYLRWMFFAPSCIEPAMLDTFEQKVRENRGSVGHGVPSDVLAAIDDALSNGPYLLGDTFSAADVVFGGTLNFALMFGAFEKKPLYTDYVDRLMTRPAALRCNDLNTGYMELLGWS